MGECESAKLAIAVHNDVLGTTLLCLTLNISEVVSCKLGLLCQHIGGGPYMGSCKGWSLSC